MREVFSKTWERLRADRSGVVSFEYVIVAIAIVGAVASVFTTQATGPIGDALTNAMTALTAAVTAAVGG